MDPFNQQAPEKVVRGDANLVDLHSIFYTIQGEGPHTGRTAVFVRLAGCNLQCPLCDTEYTHGRMHLTIAQVLGQVDKVFEDAGFPLHSEQLVVITGGEPLRQQSSLIRLAAALDAEGYDVQIETNGSLRFDDYWYNIPVDFVMSPKANVAAQNWSLCQDVKYVLSADDQDPVDGLPIHALGHPVAARVARPPAGWDGTIWLNPADHKDPEINRRNLLAVRDACLRHGYRMGVQLHKFIDVP